MPSQKRVNFIMSRNDSLEEINCAGEKLSGDEVWSDHVAPPLSAYII